MGRKHKDDPRYYIVSVRVSGKEREALERLSREHNKNVSDLLREALESIPPRKMSA